MVLVVPPMAELSVILTAKSIPALAARAMDGVGTPPHTVEPAASLVAQPHLLRRTPPPLDPMAVAALLLVVLPVILQAPTEGAAHHMDTVASLRIIAVQDVRAVAATHLALQTPLKPRPSQPHPPLLRSLFWVFQPLAPIMAR